VRRARAGVSSGSKALGMPAGLALIVLLPPSDLTTYKMILTQCAVCATELGLTLGKKCGRCSTRYCGAACQVQHWKEGGHDKLCKQIKKAGGAEQYNANNKYAEAVAVAAEACAEDTKGQTCYICTQAVHWKTKEGLVRMCACRGTAGFAHVSCLAEQAKILLDEAEYNNLGVNVINKRWLRWGECSLCKQEYHGLVACALGWACWKTYVGRPEADACRKSAMNQLGKGLNDAGHDGYALIVKEAELAIHRRLGAPESHLLTVQANLACTLDELGRYEEALPMKRDVHSGHARLFGEEASITLISANNYASCLVKLKRFEEAKSLLRKTMPVARRVLGDNDENTLRLRWSYAKALYRDPTATLDDLHEAVETHEDLERIALRVFGGAHPATEMIQGSLRESRAALSTRSVCEAMAAMTPPGDA